jgi:hypothetical protein
VTTLRLTRRRSAAEEWLNGGRRPRGGDRYARHHSGKVLLEFDEPVVPLWSPPGFRCHSATLTHGQPVGGAFDGYPGCGEG